MINWISIGDCHFKMQEPYGTGEPNTRLVKKISLLSGIVDYVLDKHPDFVVFLGDIFDMINPSETLRKLFMEQASRIFIQDIPVFIIVGNHDTNGKIFSLSSEALTDNTNFVVINKTAKVTIKGVDFLMIPWGGWDNLPDKLPKYMFGHLPISGAEVGPQNFVLDIGLKRTFLSKFIWSELGHIHKPQLIGNYSCYVGSIARNNFGERTDQKMFLHSVLESDSELPRVSQIPIDDWDFLVLDVTEESGLDNALDFLDMLLKPTCVRVNFKGSQSWIKTLNIQEIKSRIKEFDNIEYLDFVYSFNNLDDKIEINNFIAKPVKHIIFEQIKNHADGDSYKEKIGKQIIEEFL